MDDPKVIEEGAEAIELSERNRKILEAVISVYLQRAEPVGSRTVAKHVGLGLSPATIRNIMADLEDEGLLFQPHTSAGRVPTERGLRFYVDNILEKRDLSWGDQAVIEETIMASPDDVKTALRTAASLLANFTGHAVVASQPAPLDKRLLHMDFVLLRPCSVLVVSVFEGGIVRQTVIRTKEAISQERLWRMADYLNQYLSYRSIDEVREEIRMELDEDRRLFKKLVQEALDKTLSAQPQENLFVDGRANLLEQPEFLDLNRLKILLQALEEKGALLELLDRVKEASETRIFIGSKELGSALPDCGLVATPYKHKDEVMGGLGVVGPMRMDYGRVIALVEYAALVLSDKLSSCTD